MAHGLECLEGALDVRGAQPDRAAGDGREFEAHHAHIAERQRGAVRQHVLGPDLAMLGVGLEAERSLVERPRAGHVLDGQRDEIDHAVTAGLVLAAVQRHAVALGVHHEAAVADGALEGVLHQTALGAHHLDLGLEVREGDRHRPGRDGRGGQAVGRPVDEREGRAVAHVELEPLVTPVAGLQAERLLVKSLRAGHVGHGQRDEIHAVNHRTSFLVGGPHQTMQASNLSWSLGAPEKRFSFATLQTVTFGLHWSYKPRGCGSKANERGTLCKPLTQRKFEPTILLAYCGAPSGAPFYLES
ncbi:hypothetical protein D3C72_1063580 [compost metagenome]